MNETQLKQHERRVLNLVSKVDLSTAPVKKRAVIRLLLWQPSARRIRFAERCHCKRGNLLTYQLPGEEIVIRANGEQCGYYCCACEFSIAGVREVKP